jgi:2-dehydro-3-deoxyphosphooctonate aldolase (KDO 8-P synthase)
MSENSAELYSDIKKKKTFILGPCVIESRELLHSVAEEVKSISEEFDAIFVFKASFDKANRTSVSSFRGPGLEEGVELLHEIKQAYQLPVTTDIHEPHQAKKAAEVADILQIPAFLCRQTDLLLAAAETGKIVNIKKAQFLSGEDMLYPLEKVKSTGNDAIMLTERGSMFGYNNLVVDFRNIQAMKAFDVPVVMDCTHSVQRPGGLKGKTGGNREFVPYMAKAAQVFGAEAFFIETHPDPDKAKSDGPNMLHLSDLRTLISELING